MKYQKIILAGGNGYLGTVLKEYYKDLAQEIIILSRKPEQTTNNIKTLVWDGEQIGSWKDELESADLLINLCGKNVNCRYTEKNKKAILLSRINPTQLLGNVINNLKNPPKLWINIASATIYRHAEDKPQDELTGDIGTGFSIDICKQWEKVFFEQQVPKTRKVVLRLGIVLGRKDGAFPRLLNLVKFGLGGKQGDGKQYISWIHEIDAARITEWLLNHPNIEGVINATAPAALPNKDFMSILRTAYGIPIGLPSPQWLLEIGAVFIGTETELILKSRWVYPKHLLDNGFDFQFKKAEHAIHDLLSLRM